MKIGLAQVNARVGDIGGNVRRILAAVEEAHGADLVVFPELVVTGYPPRDLLLDEGFVDAAEAALPHLAKALVGGPPTLVGCPIRSGDRVPGHPGLYDAAVLLSGGRVAAHRTKRLLPVYTVFNESRWFFSGPPQPPMRLPGRKLGVLVCEDLWDEGYMSHPPVDLLRDGAQMLICPSASPFRKGVQGERLHHARRQPVPVVYVNAVGGQDELIFDGRSFVTDGKGALVAQLPAFQEDVRVVDLEGPADAPVVESDLLRDALVLGIRDFVRKNGLRDAWLGLSGGVDSALVACLAADALGKEHVHAVAMPSRYNDPRSTESAQALAEALGIDFRVVPIDAMHAAAEATVPVDGVAAENVQARLRMVILTALVNQHGGLLLNTSNKTELTLGYGTLYGDLAGAISPIGDLTKTDVVELARRDGRIPAFILDRTPTAELRPGQVDPFDYAAVAPAAEVLVAGGSADPDLARRYATSEHKRWQHGVVLHVTAHAFGRGRMIPITR